MIADHLTAEPDMPKRSFLSRAARRLLLRRLARFDGGQLAVEENGRRWEFGPASEDLPEVTICVRDTRFYRHVILGGSLGAAEAFILGYWTCDNLVGLVQRFCRDASVSRSLESKIARVSGLVAAIAHRLRRNTASGSRRNIAAHYDLGDEFFSLFLDETMAYSCAIFPRPDSTLREASLAKFDRICRKLGLTPADHLLEIGSGWGGFALHAAREYGCRVTTTTISRKQYAYTRRLVEAAGLSHRVTVLDLDYRDVRGSFDKLVSIEMIEAVGHEYFDTFFRVCSERLKPNGTMVLQAIVIPDERFERYRRSVDFIQRYIFPGGCLPSMEAIRQSIRRATDFELSHVEDITVHYADTLSFWRRQFQANLARVRALGFSDEFIRTWEFYFCYCEGGFRERAIRDVQILMSKPACHNAGASVGDVIATNDRPGIQDC